MGQANQREEQISGCCLPRSYYTNWHINGVDPGVWYLNGACTISEANPLGDQIAVIFPINMNKPNHRCKKMMYPVLSSVCSIGMRLIQEWSF